MLSCLSDRSAIESLLGKATPSARSARSPASCVPRWPRPRLNSSMMRPPPGWPTICSPSGVARARGSRRQGEQRGAVWGAQRGVVEILLCKGRQLRGAPSSTRARSLMLNLGLTPTPVLTLTGELGGGITGRSRALDESSLLGRVPERCAEGQSSACGLHRQVPETFSVPYILGIPVDAGEVHVSHATLKVGSRVAVCSAVHEKFSRRVCRVWKNILITPFRFRQAV